MTSVSVAQAEKDFTGTLRRMTANHEAIAVKQGRRTVAVMLPPDVAEALEDLADIRAADAALAKHERDPSGAVTLDEYIRRREACATR